MGGGGGGAVRAVAGVTGLGGYSTNKKTREKNRVFFFYALPSFWVSYPWHSLAGRSAPVPAQRTGGHLLPMSPHEGRRAQARKKSRTVAKKSRTAGAKAIGFPTAPLLFFQQRRPLAKSCKKIVIPCLPSLSAWVLHSPGLSAVPISYSGRAKIRSR
jgi:hypothetical protein